MCDIKASLCQNMNLMKRKTNSSFVTRGEITFKCIANVCYVNSLSAKYIDN
jgi:hypothetical protein